MTKIHGHCGENHHSAVLNDNAVRHIKLLYATGVYSYRQISELYGVHLSVIGKVVIGRIWSHVKEELWIRGC